MKVCLDFMLFCGLDLHRPVPDHSTHCRFRNALVSVGVYDALLNEVYLQLESHGLKVKEADAAIIDATLITSAGLPNSYVDGSDIAKDREESNEPEELAVHYSADEDARWVKKGSKSTFGYKGFGRCDEEGYVDKVHVIPANQGESPEFITMAQGAKAKRAKADKASASKANRAFLRDHGYRDGIMHKAVRGRPLTATQKKFNKLISKTRFRIEQCFGTQKRLFGLCRSRYFGVAKTHAQMAIAAIGQNRLKAANKITLQPQKLAIV